MRARNVAGWPAWAKGRKKHLRYFLSFFKGQLLLQVLNLATGFFLLRWLPIGEQAIFGVALSFQTLILSVSDLGFTGSIIALVGTQWNDKAVVGSYVAAAGKLRGYFFGASLVLSCFVIPLIAQKQHWGAVQVVEIFTPLLLGVYWQANCSVYDSVLVMHKRLSELFRPQLVMAGLKLAVSFLLYRLGHISAFFVISINALAFLSNGLSYKKIARQYISTDHLAGNRKQIEEIFKYVRPLLPSILFNAVNGQVQILLISLFGKTAGIAEVSALGKLSQFFLFFNSFNSLVVSPFIAKTEKKSLARNYFTVFVGALLLGTFILSFTYMFPGFLKSFLGTKYTYLSNDYIFLLVLSSTVSYWSLTLWTMSSALKWVYWWASISYVAVVVVIEVLSILLLDIATTVGVLRMGLFVNIGVLLLQLCITLVGFKKNADV